MEEKKKPHMQIGYANAAIRIEIGDKTCVQCASFRPYGAVGYGAVPGERGYCFFHQVSKAKDETCDDWHRC